MTTFLLLLVLAALIATLLLRRGRASPILNLLIAVEFAAAGYLLAVRIRPTDIAKPYQAVFRGGGYGLGRLLVESGRPPGAVLLLLPGEGEVDTWRRDGLEQALEGSGFSLAQSVVLPVDPQSGCFVAEPFNTALRAHPGLPFVAAFAGLPGAPATSGPHVVAFHATSADGMEAWWKSGRLVGVITPRLGDAPEPRRREKLAAVADSFFTVRHTEQASAP
jgi:hypothetical protein